MTKTHTHSTEWHIQQSVPIECYYLLRDDVVVAEICGPQTEQRTRHLNALVIAANSSAEPQRSASTGGLTSDLMNATTVSCTGLDITIACNDHDTKDAIMAVLVGRARDRT